MIRLKNDPIFFSKREVVPAFVISLKGNSVSESLTNRCVDSLNKLNIPCEVWDAFDGTNGQDIVVPDHLKDKEYLSWIKQSNNRLTLTEISLFLSHFSLWAHCCTLNEPIVILEHDAIMVKPYIYHKYPNTIYYLGNSGQKDGSPNLNWFFVENSYFFLPQSHAYAIDPAAARNLISHTIKFGITDPIDNFVRMDIFSVVQDDFFAYEEPGETTVIKS